LKSVTGPEMFRLIEANGWSLRRINGSHHIYSKPGERKVISVPVHGRKILKTGLALRIARDAGVDI
jgi:predicted RNA binding protein YcfA (HicA-like mRNA interferase family)